MLPAATQAGRTALLASMLHQLQEQQQRGSSQFLFQQQQHQQHPQHQHQQHHQQQQDWSSTLFRQQQMYPQQMHQQQMHAVNLADVPAGIHPYAPPLMSDVPAGMSPYAPSQMTQHGSLDTTCSSRSSTASTTAGASRGSPSNSLSTLMACNEMLKSQLQENEMRIQQCQDSTKSTSADGDSNDGTDDDSTNGTSSVSNASTTPGPCAKPRPVERAVVQSRYWSEEEHKKFLEAVRCFGAHNHKAIATFVTTRNSTQVRSHSQKFFKKLETFSGRGLPTMLRKRKAMDSEAKSGSS